MAAFLAVDEVLVSCPYDETHKLSKEKLSYHVVKCQMNFEKNRSGKEPKAVCSFNWIHQVNKDDLFWHEKQCLDKGCIIPHIAQLQDEKFKGEIQARKEISDQAFKEICFDNPEENWEEDSHHPTYDPSKRNQGSSLAPAAVPVLKTSSERKAIRSQIQQQSAEKLLEKISPGTTNDQL